MNELIVNFENHILNVASRESIIRGADGKDGQDGQPGAPGAPGEDGVSPTVEITTVTGGHAVTITDADHPSGQTFNVLDGQDGQPGQPGQQGPAGQDGAPGADGVSPTVEITTVTGGHAVTITDKDHPSGQSFNVLDGVQGPTGPGVPAGGSAGQYLKKASATDYDGEWDAIDAGDVAYDDSLTYASGTVGEELSAQKNTLNQLESEIGIVVDGKSCALGASQGQYIILKNSTISGLSDGLYTAAQPIPAGEQNVTLSMLSGPITGGGLNALNTSLLKDQYSGKSLHYLGIVTTTTVAYIIIPPALGAPSSATVTLVYEMGGSGAKTFSSFGSNTYGTYIRVDESTPMTVGHMVSVTASLVWN